MLALLRQTFHLACIPLLAVGLIASRDTRASNEKPPLCISTSAKARAGLNAQLHTLATDNRLYRQIVQLYGQPIGCTGDVGEREREGDMRLTLSWHDGATFEQSHMLPETFIIEYRHPGEVKHAQVLLKALREDARNMGLGIDWGTPTISQEGHNRIVEFNAPDAGVNGIARLVYNQSGQLVSIWLSLAL